MLMHKKSIIVSVAVAVAVVASITAIHICSSQQPRETKRRVQEITPEATPANTSHDQTGSFSTARIQEDSALQKERIQAQARIRQLESELASVRAAQQAVPDKLSESPQKTPMAAIAEMFKNPEMKDMMRAQQKLLMETTHGSLFRYLQMPPERVDAFKELLIEKQMALMDSGLSMTGDSLSAEQRKDAADRAKKLTKEYEDKMRSFLTEKDYAVYEQFEETQPERMQVHLFKQTLAPNEQLTDQQEHELILAMHEERSGFKFSTGLDQRETFDPSQFTEEAMATHLGELAQLQEAYISRAQEVLSESQVKQFMDNLKQQRAMQEMGMRMAAQMFTKPSENRQD